MPKIHPVVADVTERIRSRSVDTRRDYLERMQAAASRGRRRGHLACSNLAHSFAAAADGDKGALRNLESPNLAIVSAYNDMLSAHQPLLSFPADIKLAARAAGAVAQFAGGVPAMCDGVTQGEIGMELSLFSRDVIAMATAVALSHDVYDAGICLGVCDKIVPGLLIGALSFGHLPFLFMPAGPMPSGLPNQEKRRIRQLYAEGKVGREELLEAEARSYHAPGTCTFLGTANSNQMFMELMGLHLPGASFENPGTPIRKALTIAGAQRAVGLIDEGASLAQILDERALVNGVVGLLATGGSTNHTIHLVAVARAAGIHLEWEDFDDLSAVVPLLARVYPSGDGDVNDFHAAGGVAYLVGQLLEGGLVHADVKTVASGSGLRPYTRRLELLDRRLSWGDPVDESGNRDVLRPLDDAFDAQGGLRLLIGNLGRAIAKTSAVDDRYRAIDAPALVFESAEELQESFRDGRLERDFVAVVRNQGPRANGMPELHKLMTPLAVLQDRGHRVALITDGRLSGASGKVLSALHVTPEAVAGGAIARLRDGDRVRIDSAKGVLDAMVEATEWETRKVLPRETGPSSHGVGRELFAGFRRSVTAADQGAMSFG